MALLALSDMNAASRTSSIVSSLLAIGSIVIGLHHVWRHREKVDTNASQAVRAFTCYIFFFHILCPFEGDLSRECEQIDSKFKASRFFSESPSGDALLVTHHICSLYYAVHIW
jgi:hypothetical protein